MHRGITIALFICLSAAPAARAEVKLHPLFTDHMVLQADAKVTVWGTADPDEKVAVSVGENKAETTAGKDRAWSAQLAPMKAGGPVELKVNGITLKDVLVGDVWICSGQSNMSWPVRGAANAEEEIAAADHPRIRLFTVPRRAIATPQTDVRGQWSVCGPKTVGNFSAVAYYFGRELQPHVDRPIGLIHTSWGGSKIEAWTSAEAFEADKMLAPVLAEWAQDQPLKLNNQSPTCLYNGMIHPLLGFAVKGAIWYQGESNAKRGSPALYQEQVKVLVADWRKHFGSDFAFIQVQLANYMQRATEPTDTGWARLRESQRLAALGDDKIGMAVVIDAGEADNIHPKDKQTVGKRLALQARKIAYGQDVVASGPMFKSMAVEGDKVRLTFDSVGGGLAAGVDGKADKLAGFAVAGEDQAFHWAEAVIEPSTGSGRVGDAVVLHSDAVARPVAVRYAWANNPACNLYNKQGLPASPFRTDDW